MRVVPVALDGEEVDVEPFTDIVDDFFEPSLEQVVIEQFSAIPRAEHEMIMEHRHGGVGSSIVVHTFIVSLCLFKRYIFSE